jgi:pyruvate/2-oxoglutarate dehydrogenase complex dihydrolipoamide acyltransferase (E2) component
MSRVEVLLPKLGLTMEDGTVLEWHVSAGNEVSSGTDVVTIGADKADTTIESPCDGRVEAILVNVGETCEVGALLCVIESPR